ncbi:nucleotide pyrophosphohydrolase [Pseudoflavonifractor sp. 524-17]|nr:nucleotide pyrophosphohydrolase [Pseudoflavonifractor sp. 524-17]
MTPNEYQRLAMRTCNIPHEQKQDMLMHSVLGLASEAGEVAGIFQKKYQGHKIDPEHLEKEIGDCLWMIAEACTALGWKMETVMQTNIEKLKARYPNGFEPERSLYRRAGDD